MTKRAMPKTQQSLEKAYQDCERKKSFRKVDRYKFQDYITKNVITSEDILQDIDDFRIQRNFALYKPKAWEDITKEDIEQELNKIRNNIKILAGLL